MPDLKEAKPNNYSWVKTAEKFISSFLIIAILVVLLGNFAHLNGLVIYIAGIYMLWTILFLLPLVEWLGKKRTGEYTNSKKWEWAVQLSAGIIFTAASYGVFIYYPDKLELWFWVFIISFLAFQGIDLVRTMLVFRHNRAGKPSSANSKVSKSNLGIHIILCIFIVLGAGSLYDVERRVYTDNLKAPEGITIIQSASGNGESDISEEVKINNQDLINEIMEQIGNKELANIRNIEKIDYLKRNSRSKTRYILIFKYADKSGRSMKDGYISYIYIYDNDYAIASDFRDNRGIFKGFLWNYKIPLSEDTIRKITDEFKGGK